MNREHACFRPLLTRRCIHALATALLVVLACVSLAGCEGSGGGDDQSGFSTQDSAAPASDARAAGDAMEARDASGSQADAAASGRDAGGAAPSDGGVKDGSLATGLDASGAVDAGSATDAGRSDAGFSDAGSVTEAGASDAGGTTDAGRLPCMLPASGSKGKNPLFSDQFSADPAPLVSGCTFYIHCGHDEAASGQNGFVLREWFVLSSTDMVNWSKKVAMRVSDFSWADANAWAGQVVAKNGKFYWYVPVNERGAGMAIGVAVSDSPTGPFKDALGKPLINDRSEMASFGFSDPGQTVFTIDPTVFVDDDGQAYLHYGGFSRMVMAKLKEDMISIDGKLQEVTPRGFFEAPFLTKRNGTYYEIYAAGVNPASIDYATSNSPMGPWTYRGRILDPLPKAANQDAPTNHAGVAELAGQWYIVYHLSNGPNAGGTYRREVAVDKLTFNADGSIQKVTPSAGLSF